MARMVTAEVKAFFYNGPGSYDEPPPAVEDPLRFGLEVRVMIGTEGVAAADEFMAFPCTATWLVHELSAGRGERMAESLVTEHDAGVRPLAGVWVMDRWSQERFESAVRRLCALHSPAPDWGTVASRISRLLPWEYDYRYDDHADAHAGSTVPPTD